MATKSRSVRLTHTAWDILDRLAKQEDTNINAVVDELVTYAGMVGGDRPVTKAFKRLPGEEQEAIRCEVLERLDTNKAIRGQYFAHLLEEIAPELGTTPEQIKSLIGLALERRASKKQ